jgi:hypothetical protein
VGGVGVEVGAEVLRGGVVLTVAGMGPGHGQCSWLSVSSWRNGGRGELVTGGQKCS